MDIKNSSSGKVVKALTGYYSFIPNPLPPKLEWNNELAVSLSKANHVLGMLMRESLQLPNPHLLMRPFIMREAVLSSKIEGTRTTLSEMLAKDVDIYIDRNPDDLIEVQNYILALDYGLERIKELPLSLRLIKELYAKLMNSARGEYAIPGEFRKSQNWIGSPGCTLNTAKYVPPHPEELMNCLDSFEKFLYDRMMPSLIHIVQYVITNLKLFIHF